VPAPVLTRDPGIQSRTSVSPNKDELGLSYLHVIFTFSLRKTVYGYIRRLHECVSP